MDWRNMRNRLILLEGLPGTGKSTNSFRLYEQLLLNGKETHWIHEVSQPHPVLFFTESCMTKEEYQSFKTKYPETAELLDEVAEIRKTTVGIDQEAIRRRCHEAEKQAWYQELLQYDAFPTALDRYERQALEKWEAFASNAAKEEDAVFILDSSIFQYQIFTYLLKAASYKRLETFVLKIAECIKPLNPLLIYLYREHTEDSIAYLKEQRGEKDLVSTWERDQGEPYYQKKQKDVTAYYDFLKDYAAYAKALFDALKLDKQKIEISENNWKAYEDAMLKLLGIRRVEMPAYQAADGTFVNAEHGFSFTIQDNVMIDPEGVERRLSPKSREEFLVWGIPTILEFTEENSIRLLGQQIIPQWTETGTVYTRSERYENDPICIKSAETDEELCGRGYVHCTAWQEAYRGIVCDRYLDTMTVEATTTRARNFPENTLVAKDKEKVVGFAVYGSSRDEDLPNAGEIEAIYVLSEYYGRKVGYRLMNEAISRLKEYDTIFLWVFEKNKRAIDFYHKLGFEFDGSKKEWRLGTPVTIVRMIKKKGETPKE